MTTKQNANQFGGRYLIQDQDHMSEIRPASEQDTPSVTRQAHQAPAKQHKGNWATDRRVTRPASVG